LRLVFRLVSAGRALRPGTWRRRIDEQSPNPTSSYRARLNRQGRPALSSLLWPRCRALEARVTGCGGARCQAARGGPRRLAR
jgi:hypothetical protein